MVTKNDTKTPASGSKKSVKGAGAERAKKQPGRLKQMWNVFQMTRKNDPSAQWIILAALLIPIAAAVALSLLFGDGNGFTIALWVILGVLIGFLLAMLILGRRAERAAYSQIEGQPGAVGAVLKSGLRGSWVGNEMPVAVNAKTQDAVYRAIGRGGVALIAEGAQSRVDRMLAEEGRKITRILPNVPVHEIVVGREANSVALPKLTSTLRRKKNVLTKSEVQAIMNRLNSLQGSVLPIPKGIDPLRARAQRGRLR